VRPEELCQWKILVTLSSIEPAAFSLVMQCLNQTCRRQLRASSSVVVIVVVVVKK
jgi:hypothetical protein